ncbi:MAG: hypothetical protein HY670_09625 [Chloroflexi bacterium]|nr:hypothetical protein [Chloroflexota bacterium]
MERQDMMPTGESGRNYQTAVAQDEHPLPSTGPERSKVKMNADIEQLVSLFNDFKVWQMGLLQCRENFDCGLMMSGRRYASQFESDVEQWRAFLMEKLDNKRWNGQEWVEMGEGI